MWKGENDKSKQVYLEDLPESWKEVDIMKLIKENLSDENLQFMEFMLENVLNRKYTQSYSWKLRREYSYNEYRVKRLLLINDIKDILKKNNIKV